MGTFQLPAVTLTPVDINQKENAENKGYEYCQTGDNKHGTLRIGKSFFLVYDQL
ncbi:hypothetical protein SDC9_211726 [bioreactor metagenome]|uniref:Uncharacterized protein n=1 Tax=bioreactor metagenome TaxID=1076179 RepID=A0A645JKS7_9ZZZZ